MYTPPVRFIFVATGLFMASYFFLSHEIALGYMMLLASVLSIWGYFRNGTVSLAWGKIKKEDFASAEKIIRQTRFPHYLKKQHRGFYHFTLGIVYAHQDNAPEAYTHLTEALKFDLLTENNQAIAHLQLADIELERGRRELAAEHLQAIRTMKDLPMLESEIQRMEEKLKS